MGKIKLDETYIFAYANIFMPMLNFGIGRSFQSQKLLLRNLPGIIKDNLSFRII
jgi:hypothetical protein